MQFSTNFVTLFVTVLASMDAYAVPVEVTSTSQAQLFIPLPCTFNNLFSDLQPMWNDIKNIPSTQLSGDNLQSITSRIIARVQKATGDAQALVNQPIGIVMSTANGPISAASSTAQGTVSNVKDTTVAAGQQVTNGAQNTVSNALGFVTGTVKNTVQGVANTVQGAVSTVQVPSGGQANPGQCGAIWGSQINDLLNSLLSFKQQCPYGNVLAVGTQFSSVADAIGVLVTTVVNIQVIPEIKTAITPVLNQNAATCKSLSATVLLGFLGIANPTTGGVCH